MKPFRTNKKDRETFARVLGYRLHDRTDFKLGTDADIRDYEDNKVIGCEKGQWYFIHNGYQRVIQELNDRGFWVYQFPDCVELLVEHGNGIAECVGAGVSTNTGEALFRAVVKMGEAQK